MTFQAMAEGGRAALATDEALHDVLRIAKMVALWVSVILALMLGRSLDLVGTTSRSWQEALAGPALCCALAAVTAYGLTLSMGRLIEASVCTIFIIYENGAYQQAMESAQPGIYKKLRDTTD